MNKIYTALIVLLLSFFVSGNSVYFVPSSPDSSEIFYCYGNITENITDAHYVFDMYLDEVLFRSKDCGTELCQIRISSYATNIGDIWSCNLTIYNSSYSETVFGSINITTNELMPYYNMSDNIFVDITNNFTDVYFIWLLPMFCLGLIGYISKSISNTALAFGVVCIPLFLIFNNVVFIYLSVVIFLAGLIGKKLGV